jgi:hypothetical protein
MEGAAGGAVGGIGDFAGQADAAVLSALGGIGDWQGREQRLGVGVQRPGEERLGARDLDDLADIHHDDAVADVLDHAEIMADEEIGQPELLLQVAQQIECLRPDADIECRDRFVEHDEARMGRERPGDADALALAAGEGVRIAPSVFGPQAHLGEELADLGLDLFGRHQFVDLQHLADDVANLQARVERGLRVLEDDAQIGAIGETLVLREPVEVDAAAILTAIAHGAGGRLVDAEQEARHRRLAAAGFADEPERLALPDREGDVLDGAHRIGGLALEQAAPRREQLGQSAHIEQDIGGKCRGLSHGRRLRAQPARAQGRSARRGAGRS